METLRSAKPPCGGSIPPPASMIKHFLLSLLISVKAFDFSQAYQDYQYTLETYSNSFNYYQTARDSYLKNPTLTLKEEARKMTLEMLKNRDELMRVYLTAIKLRAEADVLNSRLDSEAIWYSNHKSNYQNGDTLTELFSKSNESENRYKIDTLPLIYYSLSYISYGDEVGLRKSQEEIYNNLKTIINEKVSAGKLDINPFNRWFSDIENIVQNLKSNESKAQSEMEKMFDETRSSPIGVYNTSLIPLTNSVILLTKLNNFLTEVSASIRNQQ